MYKIEQPQKLRTVVHFGASLDATDPEHLLVGDGEHESVTFIDQTIAAHERVTSDGISNGFQPMAEMFHLDDAPDNVIDRWRTDLRDELLGATTGGHAMP